jgi:hypothetical protein
MGRYVRDQSRFETGSLRVGAENVITKRGREQGNDFRAVAFFLRSRWNRMLLPLGLPAGLLDA